MLLSPSRKKGGEAMAGPPHAVRGRRFLQSTAMTAAGAAAGLLPAPAVLRAQGAAVKIGVLHPVSGALSYSGQQGRLGAMLAVDELNAAGGIKALGSAKI